MDSESIALGAGTAGALAPLFIFFLKRYVTSTDDQIKNLKKTISQMMRQMVTHERKMNEINIEVGRKLVEFKEQEIESHDEYLEEIRQLHSHFNELRHDFNKTLSEMKSTDKDIVEQFKKVAMIMKDYSQVKGQIKQIIKEMDEIGKVIYKKK